MVFHQYGQDDTKSGVMLRIEQYVKYQLQTNTEQEDTVSCIHEETRFRTNITGTKLAEILRYLSDVQVVEASIMEANGGQGS